MRLKSSFQGSAPDRPKPYSRLVLPIPTTSFLVPQCPQVTDRGNRVVMARPLRLEREDAHKASRVMRLPRLCEASTHSEKRACMCHVPDPAQIRHKGDGAPGGIRTPDQWLRKPLLYPAELQALKSTTYSVSGIPSTNGPVTPAEPDFGAE